MNVDAFVNGVVSQGGFAVLAAFACFLLYKMGEQWAADNKESREAVGLLQKETIAALQETAGAISALTERLGPEPRRRSSDRIPKTE